MKILNRIFYGAHHHPIVYFANLGNSAICFYFLRQYDDNYIYLFIVALLTILCYGLHEHAQGISTIWSFCYSFQKYRSIQDTLVYGIPCLSLILFPMPDISDWLQSVWGITIWPWSRDFQAIAVTAHAVFAALGFVMREIVNCIQK